MFLQLFNSNDSSNAYHLMLHLTILTYNLDNKDLHQTQVFSWGEVSIKYINVGLLQTRS